MKNGFLRLIRYGAVFVIGLLSAGWAQPVLNLPAGPVTPTITFSDTLSLPAYFGVTFSGLASGLSIANQTYNGWCADENGEIVFNNQVGPDLFSTTATYMLYNTYGPLPPLAQSPNWPAVNYLLNHKSGAGVADIQEAIWFLLNGAYHPNNFIPSPPSATTLALVAAALNNNTFIPQAGQVVAVLLDDGLGINGMGTEQDLIIEVPLPPSCGQPSLVGTYQFNVSGSGGPTPGLTPNTGGGIEAGLLTADGNGNFTFQVAFFFNGILEGNDTHSGTYTVNPNCTITLTFHPSYDNCLSAGPCFFPIHFDGAIAKGGSEIYLIATDPGVLASGEGVRI